MIKYKISYTFEGRLKSKHLYGKTKSSVKNKFYRNMKSYLSVVEVISIEEILEVFYGIWNSQKKQFQFGIVESTPDLAKRKLFKKIGYDSLKWRFEVRPVKEVKLEKS